MKAYFTFETERLYLKPTCKDDALFLLELMNTPKWHRFIGDRSIKTVEDAEKYIEEKMTPQLERLGYSNYTVIRKSDGEKLGTCGLYDREGLEGIDIGFAFLPQFEGQGYAFESANRIKEAAIHEFHLDLINAITVKDNLPSQRLLEKLGLTFVKTIQIPNDPEELLLYQWKV
ncbi:GNAT family N-acetyltransferase [Sungkyunkwania multivorans]|uniref:GNAT family N-acetyltransferase n=1 Tax=Sungkyunkwania multivorans TaxID=1173618 RepID=A0ABW3D194_9FLAO